MELLNDVALVLKRKNVNESNVCVSLYTKNYGKINCIAYGVRSSNKKEKISLNPLCYIEVQLSKTNDSYILKSYNMLKYHKNIYTNLDKLELCLYIVYVLNEILGYMQKEEKIYKRTEDAIFYIDNLNQKELKEKKYDIIISYLKKIILELGIYDNKLNFNNNNTYASLKKFERYINEYFNISINYEKILLGGK